MNRPAHSFTKALVLPGILTVLLGCMHPAPAHASPSSVRDEVHRPVRESAGSYWLWPVAPPHRIGRGFQAPATRYSAGHRGIDIVAAAGQQISAPTDAVVHFSGRVVYRPVLTLETSDGLLISMEPVESSVQHGAHVGKGDIIAATSRGGHCDAVCVHLGVRRNGEYVSPLLFLGGLERAVLLPLS